MSEGCKGGKGFWGERRKKVRPSLPEDLPFPWFHTFNTSNNEHNSTHIISSVVIEHFLATWVSCVLSNNLKRPCLIS